MTVPAAAQLLWDSRGTPQADRELNNLVIEYKDAVETGTWIPAERPDAIFPDMENESCNYLPEFARVKEGIANKKWELTEKQDFHDWIESAIVDCTTPIEQFNTLIASLTSQQESLQTTLDSTLAQAFTELLSSVPSLDETSYNQAFADAFVLA